MNTPPKQYRGESRMDYLTRTEADEETSDNWTGSVWGVLAGFTIGTIVWVGVLAYVSWRALS